jgi:hypothetical protein
MPKYLFLPKDQKHSYLKGPEKSRIYLGIMEQRENGHTMTLAVI